MRNPKENNSRQKTVLRKNALWIAPLAFFLVILILLLLYPLFVKIYIHRKVSQIEKEYRIEVNMDKMRFMRYREIFIPHMTVISGQDTLFKAKDLIVKINYFRNKKLNPYPGEIGLDYASIHYPSRKPVTVNSRSVKQTLPNEGSMAGLPEKLQGFLTSFMRYLPDKFNANSISFQLQGAENADILRVDTLFITDQVMSGDFYLRDREQLSHWKLTGKVEPEKYRYSGQLRLQEKDTGRMQLPYLKDALDLELGLDYCGFGLQLLPGRKDQTAFIAEAEIGPCHIFHPQLSDREIKIDSASLRCHVDIFPEKIVVDSVSSITVNGFTVHPYMMYEKTEDWRLMLSVNERDADAELLFGAFPEGLFQVIPDLDIAGKMDFAFFFDCDFAHIDSLQFHFRLSGPELSLSPASIPAFTRYNGDFEYMCFHKDSSFRKLHVSHQNPAFIPFDKIPFYLRNAILAAEDPSFFRHQGFIPSSIREAMAVNLQRGKFSRGGSTLTMQLVKNLFLNKRKVASRKIEEMILVWLIESRHLISKERMFEIYTNIIEWGPGVHGLYEASQFYFQKSPDVLSFGECVYLATLIRSPRSYARTLDVYGNVTPERRTEMHFIARRMLERGMVTESQYGTFNSFVSTAIHHVPETE